MKPQLPWHSRFDLLGVTFLLFLLGALGSLPAIEGSGRDLDYLGNLGRFASQFFPPDWSILDRTLEGLLETVQIALVSTLLAIIISIVLSVGAARTIAPLWLLWPTRMILNVIRTIPSLLWALLAVVIVGSNLAGVIALTFYSVGYLAKFFSETFEAANTDAQKALRSSRSQPATGIPIWSLAQCTPHHLEPLLMDARIQCTLGQHYWICRSRWYRITPKTLCGVSG